MPDTLRALYICYSSVEDPLIQTQVLAYLDGLAASGHTIHLLTFDRRLSRGTRRLVRADLRRRGVAWHSARYHRWPSLPATVFDTVCGAAFAALLMRRHRLGAIHARNHVPAAMALIVRRARGCRMIFDLRGLLGDERVDAGRWRRGGLAYRLTVHIQRAALRHADAIVTLTEAIRPYLHQTPAGRERTVVIPCCAAVERLAGRPGERAAARAAIGAGERPVLVYVGKLSGLYLAREMAQFFAVARRATPDLFFLVLTQSDPGSMTSALGSLDVGTIDYRILRVAPEDVGHYLSAGDFAISFIRPCFSKVASSPTKVGEYLSMGLPIVSTAGIGDSDALLNDHRVGLVLGELSDRSYAAGAAAIQRLRDEPGIRERCRQVAYEHLSLEDVGIPRYDELYRRVAVG
jgi:glycosyltransferase involved in cell wall biosynthesis